MRELELLAALSREFGTNDYVKGGGGNTSFKNADTLWIKPSGLCLPDMTAETFVPLDRQTLGRLYSAPTPDAPAERETLVKNMMADAVTVDAEVRASVESPLHDSFDAAYVVHTHPPLVTGMLCSREAEAVCRELFPDALWMGYVDPGYTLCMATRAELARYKEAHGHQPAIVMMKNHGVFVAADTEDEMRMLYSRMMETLRDAYQRAGVSVELPVPPPPPQDDADTLRGQLQPVMDGEARLVSSGVFAVPEGPLSPDHIVYAKSFPFVGEPSAEAFASFTETHGYWPRVIVTAQAVYGVGTSDQSAGLALLLAQDGALVQQLARAFGGPEYMDDRAREFIDNWEVEAYRRKIAGV